MAFKMNSPILRGTAKHKASIAKAKQSIVADTRTSADPNLVKAFGELGESYIPHAIDYSIDMPDVELPKAKKKKKDKSKKTKKEKVVKEETVVEEETTKKKNKLSDWWKKRKENRRNKREEAKKKKEADAEKKRIAEEEKRKAAEERKKIAERKNQPKQKERKVQIEQKELDVDDTVELKTLQEKAKLPESKKVLPAHENPKYAVNVSDDPDLMMTTTNWAGNIDPHRTAVEDLWKNNIQYSDHFSGSYRGHEDQGTYQYSTVVVDGEEKEFWTYDNQQINENEVPVEAYTRIMNDKISLDVETQRSNKQKENEKDVTINNGKVIIKEPIQRDSVDVQPTSSSDSRSVPEQLKAGNLRRKDKKYENAGPSVRENMVADGYIPKEQRESTSAMQMRDDRIYRNAKPGGPVRKNMINSGYTPPN